MTWELSPLQEQGVQWLQEKDRRYLADPPGFGKTRQLLAAVGEVPTLVVCPAAIRDAEVWQTEADAIGWDAPMHVISYHQLAKGKNAFDPTGFEGLIFDEAHWLKNRKVSWGDPGLHASKLIPKVYLGSGTPTPNVASELWGQLRMVRDTAAISGPWNRETGGKLPAFWRWASGNIDKCEGWFHITTETDKAGHVLTEYAINGHLEACVLDPEGCVNAQLDSRGLLKPISNQDCKHWAEFRRIEQEPYMLGRPEELLDLPPMSGFDTPLLTPMKPQQKKLYNQLKKDFLAQLPSEGVDIEALNSSQQFVQMWMLSTGVSSVDPDQDVDDRHSGKLALLAEKLEDRKNPTLVGTYFRNSATAVIRVCRRMNLRYTTFGASTTAKGRKEAVRAFQAGELDVMIGSIPVVGEGLTLTAADNVKLVERMWTPDKNAQVVRRVRRRGQDKPVGVDQLVTPDSVDAGQWEALHTKRDRIAKVDVVRLLEGQLAYLD